MAKSRADFHSPEFGPTVLTQTAPRTAHLDGLSPHGFHRVCYYEWGDPANTQVVICVHGLSRNGRDFDVLGEALAPTHRVLAVDMPGRGASAWLADANDYTFPTYLGTLTALIARSGAERVSWVGTSHGRAARHGDGGAAQYARRAAGDQRCRTADRAAGAGPHSQLPGPRSDLRDVRRSRCLHSYRVGALWRADRRAMGPPDPHQRRAACGWPLGAHLRSGHRRCRFATMPRRRTCGRVWDAIRCPVLVLRGADSDLLSPATASADDEARARSPTFSNSRASATRRCC